MKRPDRQRRSLVIWRSVLLGVTAAILGASSTEAEEINGVRCDNGPAECLKLQGPALDNGVFRLYQTVFHRLQGYGLVSPSTFSEYRFAVGNSRLTLHYFVYDPTNPAKTCEEFLDNFDYALSIGNSFEQHLRNGPALFASNPRESRSICWSISESLLGMYPSVSRDYKLSMCKEISVAFHIYTKPPPKDDADLINYRKSITECSRSMDPDL